MTELERRLKNVEESLNPEIGGCSVVAYRNWTDEEALQYMKKYHAEHDSPMTAAQEADFMAYRQKNHEKYGPEEDKNEIGNCIHLDEFRGDFSRCESCEIPKQNRIRIIFRTI